MLTQCTFCTGCSTTSPPCAIKELKTNISIENILFNTQHFKILPIFLCPFDAQSLDNGFLHIDSTKCIHCNICQLSCSSITNQVTTIDTTELEDYLFSSLHYMCTVLNILFRKLGLEFYPEVKIKGNSRNKRLDIVAYNHEALYLFKVCNSLDEVSYYDRSYQNSILDLKDLLPSKTKIYVIFLFKSSSFNDIDNSELTHFKVPFNKLENFLSNHRR